MTEGELAMFERMYASGMPMKQIAHALGYSRHTLHYHMRADPERFPTRRQGPSHGPEERARWAARILAGELTCREVAEACGVDRSNIYRWVKEARHAQH